MRRIRVEIRGKDEFWGRAFSIEWHHRFPYRELALVPDGSYLVEPDWMEDLQRVAADTFCRVLSAPENPRRRRWLGALARMHRDNNHR
jgi:hypothetical protein